MNPSDRDELLERIVRDGILHRSPTQPIVSRDGSTASPWMLDSLAVTLTPRGAELAARCLLSLLERFDGRQLVTYGLTGVPLMQSCIALGGGRFHGLLVRKELKSHGSLKRIEGPIDPDEPVVIVDDSVSSGLSMHECCEHLAAAGLRVEGCVSLVRFGWERGFAEMLARGFRMESVFDLWTEVLPRVPGEIALPANAGREFERYDRSSARFGERQHPATLAREVIAAAMEVGRVPLAPDAFDRECDGAGGVFVSVRSTANLAQRHARDGFFNLPGDPCESVAEQLVLAAMRVARTLPAGAEGTSLLAQSTVAVTFLSALEAVDVGQIDNDRYGIFVRSRVRPFEAGGALPRMPGIASTWEQFEHARTRNAKLAEFEPFELFRYDVAKHVEPGREWPSDGVAAPGLPAWINDPERAGRVASHARSVVIALREGLSEPGETLPTSLCGDDEVESVFVTVYLGGRLVGCMGGPFSSLDEGVRAAARRAWTDGRFDPADRADRDAPLVVTVTLLHDARELGTMLPADVACEVKSGRHALMVHQGDRTGLLLPFNAATEDLHGEDFALEVVDKAGITRPPYHWTRYEAATWLADESGVRAVDGAFPRRVARRAPVLREMADAMIDYLALHQRDDGSLLLGYRPFQNEAFEGEDPIRLAHVGAVLARAASRLGRSELHSRAARAIESVRASSSWPQSPSDESLAGARAAIIAFVLLHRCESPVPAGTESRALASALWNRIDRHGAIPTPYEHPDHSEAAQDYEPGQTMLALARACATGHTSVDTPRLTRAFRYYRHRFRFRRSWPQVTWQMQSAAAWWTVTRERDFVDYVFEIADDIVRHAQGDTGAFLDGDPQPWPGFMNGVYLEGLAPAVILAREVGDHTRAQRYFTAATNTLRLLDSLLVKPEDAVILPNPRWALGGVRRSTMSSLVRTDFVQHALGAVLSMMDATVVG